MFSTRIWGRTWVTVWRISSGVIPPWTSMSHPCSGSRLPQEIIEMVIAYLVYDIPSLLACCLTCCSWYIAAAANLHHTLITLILKNQENWWPNSFRNMHKLGLFPLVKRFQI